MNPTHRTPTAAIWYPRVSKTNGRDAEDLERTTLSEQRDLSQNFLPRSVEMIERPEFKDVNVSAKNATRPGLEAAFAAIEAGEADAIVVGYLSRFGRNARELLDNLERLGALGATLYVARDGLVVTPGTRGTAKMLFTVLGAVAEWELDRLSEGLERSNRNALAAGVSIQVPYGYRRTNGNGSVLEPDEDDEHMPEGWTPADVVRQVFRWRADGLGDTAIADRLEDLGLPTPTALEHLRGQRKAPGAKHWQVNTVANLVAEPTGRTYTGFIPRATAFKTYTTKTGAERRRAVAWEYLPGGHVALVDDDLYQDAQRVRERRPPKRNGDALLTGLVRCANCSQTMRPTIGGGGRGGNKVLVYKCKGRKAGCDRPSSIVRHMLDSYVVDRVTGGHVEVETSERFDPAALDDAQAEFDAADEDLAAFNDNADAALLGEDYMPNYLRRKGRRDEAARTLAALKAQAGARRRHTFQRWDDLPLAERQEALRGALDAVVVTRSPAPGQVGDLADRVHLVGAGRAPYVLSGTGRTVEPRRWPL